MPDLGALTAAYLGLTARRNVAPAVGGSVVLGYLVDLISGAPPGLVALVLALTSIIARAVQQRIYVRGATMTIAYSAFVALLAGIVAMFDPRALPRALGDDVDRATPPRARRGARPASSARSCGRSSAGSTPLTRAPIASATRALEGLAP